MNKMKRQRKLSSSKPGGYKLFMHVIKSSSHTPLAD